ncbi:hypothetical protein HDU92_005619 [Lobulomyces angularis]|nr:hypothetical protein HDU92_005619 [Lobulomyces angularis]
MTAELSMEVGESALVNERFQNELKKRDIQNVVKAQKGNDNNFTSKLLAKVEFKSGDIIAKLDGLTFAKKRWSTVQVSKDTHVELNSDLVYMNHNCDPSVIINTEELIVQAIKDIPIDGEIHFFYPSSEWDMDQSFQCWCQHSNCIKTVSGAKNLSMDVLNKYFINSHILNLKNEN